MTRHLDHRLFVRDPFWFNLFEVSKDSKITRLYIQVNHGLYKLRKVLCVLIKLVQMAFYAIHMTYQHTSDPACCFL